MKTKFKEYPKAKIRFREAQGAGGMIWDVFSDNQYIGSAIRLQKGRSITFGINSTFWSDHQISEISKFLKKLRKIKE